MKRPTSVLLGIALAASALSQTNWVRQAPTSLDRKWRGVFGIDSNHAWVVGTRETVAETRDGGASWQIHHTASTDHSPFNAVAFSIPSRGIVGGNGDSDLFTTDGGTTWSMNSGYLNSIQVDQFDFVSSTVGFAYYSTGLRKTLDGGQTWNAIIPNLEIQKYSMDFLDANVGLIGGEDLGNFEPGIFKTTNGGATWARKYSNAVNALLWVDASSAIAIDQDQVVRSFNGGESWLPFSTLPTAGIIRLSRFAGTNVLVGISADSAIYRSANLGASWTQVKPSSGQPYFPDRNANIHCADATAGWAVGDPGCIWRSVDQGMTWQQVSNSGTVNIVDMKMFDSQFGIAIGRPNYVLVTQNGGKHWEVSKQTVEEITTAYESGLYEVDIVDSSFAVAAGDGGLALKTQDGGQNWTSIGYPILDNNFWINAIDFVDQNLGWVAGYDYGVGTHESNLFKTTDGGGTWTAIQTNLESQGFTQAGGFEEMHWIDANKGFLTGTSSTPHLIRTLDGGNTWSRVPMPSHIYSPYIWDIQFRNNTEGWIIGGYGYCLKSTDGGASWNKLNFATVMHGFVSVTFPGPNKVWIFGGDAQQKPLVYKSNNGGATWSWEYIQIFPYVPQTATATPNGQVWWATGMGTIHTNADHMKRYSPTKQTILNGNWVSGTVKHASESDNLYVQLSRVSEPNLQNMKIEYTFAGLNSNTSMLNFSVETRAVGSICSEKVELYDWRTRSWKTVLYDGPSSGDHQYDLDITDRPSRFIQSPKGLVRMRLTCSQDQAAFWSPWEFLIDEVRLLATP
jgi:photosystem II stability/assembly factor-like uncharacterized protein